MVGGSNQGGVLRGDEKGDREGAKAAEVIYCKGDESSIVAENGADSGFRGIVMPCVA
jgi:hypothetical protein